MTAPALWIILILMFVGAILIAVYQDKVVEVCVLIYSLEYSNIIQKLRPFSEKVRDIPAGWLIFILILFVLNFPPLMGDEIVEILCGIIYGLWGGFGIVAVGTYLGQGQFQIFNFTIFTS